MTKTGENTTMNKWDDRTQGPYAFFGLHAGGRLSCPACPALPSSPSVFSIGTLIPVCPSGTADWQPEEYSDRSCLGKVGAAWQRQLGGPLREADDL